MKKRLNVTERWFYSQFLRIPWTDHRNNEEVLKKIGTRKILILKIGKS